MSVLIIQSQIYFGNSVPSGCCPAFLLRMNKDHGTDCNLCKLHVCLQLYFTYSIYHLQTIPQRNMYRTFEKGMEIWWQSVFLSFVSDAAWSAAWSLCLYLECASSVMSCSSLFSFVLSAFTRINYSPWNDITTIKQRRRRKDFIQGCSEVYMCTIGDFGQMWASNMFSHLTWGKPRCPHFSILHLKTNATCEF